jgi:hypothetical protein
MTPQEYALTCRLASGSATWRNYVQTLCQNPQIVNLSNFASILALTTQPSGGTTVANKVPLDTIDAVNGITLSNNELSVSNSGQYLINWLGQFKFTGGGTGGNITTWYTINGVPASNAAFTSYLPTSNNFQVLTNVEDINTLNVGDKLAFWWWSDISPAANVSLTYVAAGTNPTRPASPSAKVSISQLN